MRLTGQGRIAGVVGWPIAHSLSPLLHGYWLEELKLDGALVPLGVAREDFALVIQSLQHAGFKGVNVTVPHKQAAFSLAHCCDDTAAICGAANLLVFAADGRIEARNTDRVGLRQALGEAVPGLQGRTAAVLGAGGAARAAVLALDDLGASPIHVLNRHADKAQALAEGLKKAVTAELVPHDLQQWPKVAGKADLLLNTTSGGMVGHAPLALDLKGLKREAWVVDIVYNPLETDLLTRAKALGHPVLDGLGMLMHQAAPSFEAFFGIRPTVSLALRAKLTEALHG